jgi:hypothetical protein
MLTANGHRGVAMLLGGLVVAASLGGCSDASDESGSAAAGVSQATLDSVRQRLGDRLFEFGHSSGNSDRNAYVTGVDQLQLCRAGIFGLKETTSFSSSVGSMTSETMHYGTWTLRGEGGVIIVDLKIDRSTDKDPPASKQYAVQIVDDAVRIDGKAVMSEHDMTSDCASAQENR